MFKSIDSDRYGISKQSGLVVKLLLLDQLNLTMKNINFDLTKHQTYYWILVYGRERDLCGKKCRICLHVREGTNCRPLALFLLGMLPEFWPSQVSPNLDGLEFHLILYFIASNIFLAECLQSPNRTINFSPNVINFSPNSWLL